KNRLGHITREGAPVVRQLVAEAAWQAQRRSPTVRAYFERVQRGDPQRKKIALVATAHYLVRVMWALLKRGTVWEEKTVIVAWRRATHDEESLVIVAWRRATHDEESLVRR